jgi:hypothetical protein
MFEIAIEKKKGIGRERGKRKKRRILKSYLCDLLFYKTLVPLFSLVLKLFSM